MKHLLAAVLCASTLAVAACGRDAGTTASAPDESAPPAVASAAKPVADALPTDVISEVDHGSAPDGFDVRAFAGTFGGDDVSLELKADGGYALRGAALPAPGDGTWTVEEGGKRIRLDPDSKDEEDRLFSVVSNDELQPLDDDGQPPADAPAGTLTRVE